MMRLPRRLSIFLLFRCTLMVYQKRLNMLWSSFLTRQLCCRSRYHHRRTIPDTNRFASMRGGLQPYSRPASNRLPASTPWTLPPLEEPRHWIYTYKVLTLQAEVGAMKEASFKVVVAVIKAVWRFCVDVVVSAELQEVEPPLHDSDFHGVYNYRTGRLDAGTDPFGWYERD